MSEGYDAGKEDASYAWLDEFLCEYVDGTMDPGTRAAFEEYLRANPALRHHVQCLCHTRQLLCRHGACHAPHGFQARLRQRLAREIIATQHPLWPNVATRLGTYASWTSLMIVVFTVGMLAGTTILNEAPYTARSVSEAVEVEHRGTPLAPLRTAEALWWRSSPRAELALSAAMTPVPASLRADRPTRPAAHLSDTLQATYRALPGTP